MFRGTWEPVRMPEGYRGTKKVRNPCCRDCFSPSSYCRFALTSATSKALKTFLISHFLSIPYLLSDHQYVFHSTSSTVDLRCHINLLFLSNLFFFLLHGIKRTSLISNFPSAVSRLCLLTTSSFQVGPLQRSLMERRLIL